MHDDEADTFTEATAWEHIRVLLGILISSFGLPHQIAAMRHLTRKTRAHILQWLAAAEALARRMLLIHAATLPKPNARAPGKAKRLNMNATHGRAGFANDDDSEKWSVAFQLFEKPKRPPAKSTSTKNRRPLERLYDSRAIAERIEALLRVAANPDPYAQRLARKLHAKPGRARQLAKPIKWRRGVNPAGSMLHAAQPMALIAASLFPNSS